MLTILLAASSVLPFQAQSNEDQLRAIAETIKRTSKDHGCDESLFEYWQHTRFDQKHDWLSTLDIGVCHIALYSKGAVQLQWESWRSHLRKLSQTERDNAWKLEQCQDLANHLLQRLRPGVRWSLARTDHNEDEGTAKFTFQGWYGEYLFREPFMGAAQVEIDLTDGRIFWMYVPATPKVLPENGVPFATESVLRTTATDVYAGYQPYNESRVGLAEFCVTSPRLLVNSHTNFTQRHHAIADRGEGLLMYRVVFQRVQNGEPKGDFQYVYVDATTGVPLAMYEWALEGSGRGSKEPEVSKAFAFDGPVRTAGEKGSFVVLEGIGDPDDFTSVNVLIEYEGGAIVKAEFDSAQSLLRIGETEAKYYTVGPELKASLDASIERREKLPPWKKPDAPHSGE